MRRRRRETVTRLSVLIWTVRWKGRGHRRNHDPYFCPHRDKVWRWRTEDGCQGRVCGFCHLIEPWSPTNLPEIEELRRTRYNGEPDLGWSWPGTSGLTGEAAIDRLLSESEPNPFSGAVCVGVADMEERYHRSEGGGGMAERSLRPGPRSATYLAFLEDDPLLEEART